LAYEIGMADDEMMRLVEKKNQGVFSFKKYLSETGVKPFNANPILESVGSSPIPQQVKFTSIITRPNVNMEHLVQMDEVLADKVSVYNLEHSDIVQQTEIQLKYEGYIHREEEMALKMHRLDELKIPDDMDYSHLKSISLEAREKLNAIRPITIGHASRISGISPSDISVLLIYLGR
jgi:tRNA uridine 5-carboxymethylaminomethyl modification enzyme